MRNSFVGTEHLLLALLRESDAAAVKILNACGVAENAFTEELVNDLSRPESEFRGSKGGKKGKSSTPTLDEFGTDLTEKARNGGIDPVIGREEQKTTPALSASPVSVKRQLRKAWLLR